MYSRQSFENLQEHLRDKKLFPGNRPYVRNPGFHANARYKIVRSKSKSSKVRKSVGKPRRPGKPYSSKYTGVTWIKRNMTWRAQIQHQNKVRFAGNYCDEITAARAVNAKCMELAIPMKNPNVPLPLTIDLQKPPKRRKGKDAVNGSHAKNETCTQMERKPNNKYSRVHRAEMEEYPGSELSDNNVESESEKTPFIGVTWKADDCGWMAQLKYRGRCYDLGIYKEDHQAAHAINLKCRELHIPPVNPKLYRRKPQPKIKPYIPSNVKAHKCLQCGERGFLIESCEELKHCGKHYAFGYQCDICDVSNSYPMIHCKCGFDICRTCEKSKLQDKSNLQQNGGVNNDPQNKSAITKTITNQHLVQGFDKSCLHGLRKRNLLLKHRLNVRDPNQSELLWLSLAKRGHDLATIALKQLMKRSDQPDN